MTFNSKNMGFMKNIFVGRKFSWSIRKKGKHIFNACANLAIFAISVVAFSGVANANPQGGVVAFGSATINNISATELNINQHTDKALINWDSFDIEKGETTKFIQPSAGSIAVNRISNSNQLTSINGNLDANGQVIVINPNGVIIGADGNIDTSGFVATTADIDNNEFANSTGKLNFNKAGNADASVENRGKITIKDAGLAALVAPTVKNDGVIQGNLSKVQLAGADTFAVDIYGDGLFNFEVKNPTDGSKRTVKSENNGQIITDGGKVLMTAAAASNVVDSVVNNKGTIQAKSLVNNNGEIILTGENSEVNVSGKLDVSGENGGGTIKVGGDYQGKGALAKAKKINVTEVAEIKANATKNGDGGKIFLWSEEHTVATAKFEAKGGAEGGNGGFVETSSKGTLYVDGASVNTLAPKGKVGTWLLDPDNINIKTTGVSYTPLPATGTSDVNVSTINAALSNVALRANNSISINAGVNIAAAGVGISLVAGTNGSQISGTDINGTAISLTGGTGSISMSGGNFIRTNGGDIILLSGDTIGISNATLYTRGGDVTLISGDIQFNNSSSIYLAVVMC